MSTCDMIQPPNTSPWTASCGWDGRSAGRFCGSSRSNRSWRGLSSPQYAAARRPVGRGRRQRREAASRQYNVRKLHTRKSSRPPMHASGTAADPSPMRRFPCFRRFPRRLRPPPQRLANHPAAAAVPDHLQMARRARARLPDWREGREPRRAGRDEAHRRPPSYVQQISDRPRRTVGRHRARGRRGLLVVAALVRLSTSLFTELREILSRRSPRAGASSRCRCSGIPHGLSLRFHLSARPAACRATSSAARAASSS